MILNVDIALKLINYTSLKDQGLHYFKINSVLKTFSYLSQSLWKFANELYSVFVIEDTHLNYEIFFGIVFCLIFFFECRKRIYIVVGSCFFFFLCGVPMCTTGGIHLFQIFDQRCTSSLLLLCFVEVTILPPFYFSAL